MAHYYLPYREKGKPSTTVYAAPSIMTLIHMFLDRGSTVENLEAQFYGGAQQSTHDKYTPGLHIDNVNVGVEILTKASVPIIGKDTGGQRGRKIVFDTLTGESAVMKVNRIRYEDWYFSASHQYKMSHKKGEDNSPLI